MFKPCARCSRLLVPLRSGGLPPHRVPARPQVRAMGAEMSTRLTGTGDPWCYGR
jgi:hypothetical protein